MTIKVILTEPNKILRQVSKPVEKVGKEEQNLMDDSVKVRIDNHMWRKYLHKDPYQDPSFGLFVKNVLFGSPKIKQ